MADAENLPGDERFARLTKSPELFLKDFNPDRDLAVLTPMTEDSYRASVFMDGRLIRAGERDLGVSLNTLGRLWAREGTPPAPVHYIGHVGHCGSTLLSRMLGDLPGFLALREPPVLVALSRSSRYLGSPGFALTPIHWRQLLELAALMLQRTWRAGDVALVKPTSAANNLLPPLLTRTGRERAILLYVHLEDWLPHMLRPDTAREIALFARDFRRRDFASLGADEELSPRSPGELAAMTWMLQALEFRHLLQQAGFDGRVRRLHFETLLADPVAVLTELAAWLGQPTSADEAARVARRHLSVDAKDPGRPHDASRRARELERARRAEAGEIRRGLAWAETAAGRIPALAGLREILPPRA